MSGSGYNFCIHMWPYLQEHICNKKILIKKWTLFSFWNTRFNSLYIFLSFEWQNECFWNYIYCDIIFIKEYAYLILKSILTMYKCIIFIKFYLNMFIFFVKSILFVDIFQIYMYYKFYFLILLYYLIAKYDNIILTINHHNCSNKLW